MVGVSRTNMCTVSWSKSPGSQLQFGEASSSPVELSSVPKGHLHLERPLGQAAGQQWLHGLHGSPLTRVGIQAPTSHKDTSNQCPNLWAAWPVLCP